MTALEYMHALTRILERIETEQMPDIVRAGKMVAASIANRGVLHTFGSGHSHMIAEEAFFRAGGLAAVNAILDPRLEFLEGAAESTAAERETGYAQWLLDREKVQAGDVGIVISNSGRNAVPIEMAMAMRAVGMKVIAITNVRQSAKAESRHSSGKRLFEIADLAIDTGIPDGDAVLDLPASRSRIGPASTVAGCAIINSIVIEAAAALQANGHDVPVFPSANLEADADQKLEKMLSRWSSRVRLFRAGGSQHPLGSN